MSDDEQPDAAWWPLTWLHGANAVAAVEPTPIAIFTYDVIRVYTNRQGGYSISLWRTGPTVDYTVKHVDDIFALRVELMRIQNPYPEGN